MIYEYSEKIPENLCETVGCVLNTTVQSVERLGGGEVNYSFRVDIEGGPVIARVFRYEPDNKEEKLGFVNNILEDLGICYSEIFYFDDSDTYFPNGFMIGEWIEGIPGREALDKGIVEMEDMFRETAKVLKRIHTVGFDRFGGLPLKSEEDGFTDFGSFVLREFSRNRLGSMVKESLISRGLLERSRKKLESLLAQIDFPLIPVFVHGDATPHNVIWTDGGPVLIDWEDVQANSWLFELAWMTFWGYPAWEPFLDGYGSYKLSEDQLRLLESIFHLQLAVELLPYYAYQLQDKKRLEDGIEKAETLLSTA